MIIAEIYGVDSGFRHRLIFVGIAKAVRSVAGIHHYYHAELTGCPYEHDWAAT